MNFLFLYTNLVRVVLVIMTVVQLFKHNYKKLTPAVIVITFTFVPWLLSLMHVRML